MTSPRFATRLNSFASGAHLEWPGQSGKPTIMQMAERAAKVKGLTDVDLNYPDHVGEDPAALARRQASMMTFNALVLEALPKVSYAWRI